MPSNPLADCGLPRFFAVSDETASRFTAPEPHGADAVRFCGRSLEGMQKEAVLRTSAGGVWRLASDEGAYLNCGRSWWMPSRPLLSAPWSGRRCETRSLAPGHADPVETHVFLDTPEDEAFAREVLDMGERTCFLHALCRSTGSIELEVTTRRTPVAGSV